MSAFVLPLDSPDASLARVGGKGTSLAKLAQHGLPVPPGFHISTDAYQRFVTTSGLRSKIEAILSDAEQASGANWDGVEKDIASWFAAEAMPEEIAREIGDAYCAMGKDAVVAVRSSATAEDLPGMSFAGQQQSFLNIHGDEALVDAVKACWASLWTARAIQYRSRQGIDHASVTMGVVVQKLVLADAAGILFTADPVTGARDKLLINAAFGLGEAVVGGDVSPDTIVVDKSKMVIENQTISSKKVMTERSDKGTRTVPVALEKQDEPVLNSAEALDLARLGVRVEALWGGPVDIEWARAAGELFLLQARPITGLREPPPQLLTWNDSLLGDYLWTSANVGEAIPHVMTPITWSIVQRFMTDAMFEQNIAGHLLYGNIGGRFYLNLSVMAGMAAAFGMKGKIDHATEQVFGRLPEGLQMPDPKISRWKLLKELLPTAFRAKRRVQANLKELPNFLQTAAKRSEELRLASKQAKSAPELVNLWHDKIEPFFRQACQMLQAAGKQDGTGLTEARRELRDRVGETDANTLLTGLHGSSGELASLGPLLGLTKVANGEMSRDEYARLYGHRSTDEFEISIPRPAEDPDWIDRQLARLQSVVDGPRELLAKKEAERNVVWQRLASKSPRELAKIRRDVDRWSAIARGREFARSESIRCFWVARSFVLRAGEITGQSDAIFFLTIDEILALLSGDQSSLAHVDQRRATYEAYSALPAYPTLIRGAFEPFEWAKNPNRRSDLFDATASAPIASDTIRGFPGAIGIVEGRVRVLASPEEGDALQTGEILVTTVTNIGWTPIFPRAAAVVTDVGAPLSHAAIVARELGIPAVVGCGNAMMRLKTGDLVRVDGARGIVERVTDANGH